MLSTYLYGAHLTLDNPQAKMFTNVIKWVILILFTPVMALIGIPILRNAINGEKINISTDLLVALASFSTYFLSVYSVLTDKPYIYFETATGRYIEISYGAKT